MFQLHLFPYHFQDEKEWFSGIYIDIALHTAILSSLRTCSREIFKDYAANDYAEAFMAVTKAKYELIIDINHKNPKKMDGTSKLLEGTHLKVFDMNTKKIDEDAMAGKMIEYNIDELKKLTPF